MYESQLTSNLNLRKIIDKFGTEELLTSTNVNWDILDREVYILASQAVSVLKYEQFKVATADGYDWQPAIQMALDSGFKAVFLPDGEYLVNRQVQIGDDTVLAMAYNATIVRNFAIGGSGGATIRNKKVSNTNRNRNIGIFGGCIKAKDSSKTGKHLAMWGVDGVVISHLKMRDVYGDWSTIFRDCYTVFIDGLDIDTIGATLYSDGLHITGGADYVINNLVVKSGDDCISLTVETPEDTNIDRVTITNASLTTRRSSIIKMTTKTGTTATIKNVSIRGVKGIGGTLDAGEAIVIKDEDNAGRISDVEIFAKADCSKGAGVGFRLQGANKVTGKVDIDKPQGKGADISYCNDWDLDIGVDSPRTAGVSGISLAKVDSFNLNARVDNATLHGIAVGAASLPATNGKITGRVRKSTNTDVRLINANGVDVEGVFCNGASGIVEDTGSDWNAVRSCDVRNVTGATKIAMNGSNSKIPQGNRGYNSFNRGTSAVATGATSINIAHGLSDAPSSAGITLTLTGTLGAAKELKVTASNATTFTVSTDVAPGVANCTFMWTAFIAKY